MLAGVFVGFWKTEDV